VTAPAPCTWPVVYPSDCSALETPDAALLYEEIAGNYLRNWTGYGTCPVLLRPCRSDCDSFSSFWGYGPFTRGTASRKSSQGFGWGPVLINGQWYNLGCGVCGDDCSCSGGGAAALRLPGPVAAITTVLVGGAPLLASAYRVDNHALLVRTDGGAWPTCQDMSEPADGPNAFSIDYLHGIEVPVGGQLAAGALACELAKAATGDTSCQLPRRIQTIARQGLTTSFLDSMDDLDEGRTGIWLVDSWVASVTNSPQRGRVYSVDIPRPRIPTWTAP